MSPVADSITRQNEKARDRAKARGQTTYQHQIVDFWPACTTCGTRLRPLVADRYRRCGCPDVGWLCRLDGWERVDLAHTTTPAPEETTDV